MTYAAIRIEPEPVPRSGRERRMTNQLVSYWYELRGAHAVPLLRDFSVEAVPNFGPHSFLLDLASGLADTVIRYIGQALAKDCKADLTQKRISAVPSTSLLAYAVDRRIKVVSTKRPVSFEGQYVDEEGLERLYRGILLPLSNDGTDVHFIVGSISCRTGSAAQKSSEPTSARPTPETETDLVWESPIEEPAEVPAAEVEQPAEAQAAEIDQPGAEVAVRRIEWCLPEHGVEPGYTRDARRATPPFISPEIGRSSDQAQILIKVSRAYVRPASPSTRRRSEGSRR